MVSDSYFRFDNDNNKSTYSHAHPSQDNNVSSRHTAPYIDQKIIERIGFIWDTQSAAYTWQALPKDKFM